MDSGDSTECNRCVRTKTEYYDTCELYCYNKALLRSFRGYRYAFLHFRRMLT